MRINGEWYPCDDGFIRPAVVGRVLTGEGRWIEVRFLVDSGADWTTFSPDAVRELRTTLEPADHGLVGIGGWSETFALTTAIQFECEGGFDAKCHGTFGALAEDGSLDMSILGRDILNLFTVILDRQNDIVALINQHHRYSITSD